MLTAPGFETAPFGKSYLPEDAQLYEPMMGVRVRESSRVKLPFLGSDPVMGISAINLLEEMPAYQVASSSCPLLAP